MKILIFGLPRTGSKRFREIVTSHTKSFLKTDTIFSPHEPKTKNAFRNINGRWVRDGSLPEMSDEELIRHYTRELSKHNTPIVMNLHYYNGIGDKEKELARQFDKVFVLKRKNTFEQVLSHRIAEAGGNCYVPDETQAKFIEQSKNCGGIELDEFLFINSLEQYLSIKNDCLEGATVVYSEDFFNIKSNEDFYKLTNLPPVDNFDATSSTWTPEFSTHKREMVKNYDRLYEIYLKVINNE